MTIAKLPLAKNLTKVAFSDGPVNEALVGDLADGAFLAQKRNIVLVGGTGRERHSNTTRLIAAVRSADSLPRSPRRSAGSGPRARPIDPYLSIVHIK